MVKASFYCFIRKAHFFSISSLTCLMSCNQSADELKATPQVSFKLTASTDPRELLQDREQRYDEGEWSDLSIVESEIHIDESSTGNEDQGELTIEELRSCALEFGSSRSRLLTAGSDQPLLPSSIVAVKVSGVHGNLKLDILGYAGQEIAGICVHAPGDDAQIEINVGMDVEALYYNGVGRHSLGSVNVFERSNIYNLKAELKGSAAKLKISGPGNYPCETVRSEGARSQFSCD